MTSGGDQITIRDVYDATQLSSGKIDAVNNQVTDLRARVEVQFDSGQRKMDDHEKRIRALEQARWKLAGMVTLIAASAGIVAALIEHH